MLPCKMKRWKEKKGSRATPSQAKFAWHILSTLLNLTKNCSFIHYPPLVTYFSYILLVYSLSTPLDLSFTRNRKYVVYLLFIPMDYFSPAPWIHKKYST
ncbi:hypothetical protein DL96DRAFT_1614018 [Flagelloscypha sp. PMI_526]|nr:hypothetical protein DL96DRAFT_1614018 [Flagelloscypha sp. PMI_526]